ITSREAHDLQSLRQTKELSNQIGRSATHPGEMRSMADSKGSETSLADPILDQKIHAIYTSGDESAVKQMTKLLVDALCTRDDHSRSALGQFFDLPTISRTESDAATINLDLLYRVHLFINSANAYRVQSWILSYKTSTP